MSAITKSISQKSLFSHEVPWIKVCRNAPYFEDENGENFTPIGQNDAITWPDFQSLFRRKDIYAVDAHLAFLAAHGVNCIRMMMEYCQTDNRYLEKPVGKFQPNMVQFWDDLFVLCEKYKIRILITPFDTFWMARRWKFHPYNKQNSGPCSSKWQWLKSDEMREAIKNRFDFFIERWGASGTLFGWDLWNEISPVHAGKSTDLMIRYVTEISRHIREKEIALYKQSHLQTVSVFAPTLSKFDMNYITFEHTMLDFATTHFYHPSIDNPNNVNAAAQITADMVKDSLAKIPASRPFIDSEHGPITYFKKHKRGLPETFDDAYFLHMQWAHVSSGAAGGGMRWPYRHPHVLTHGMRRAQLNLSEFVKLIDWQNFRRTNLSDLLNASDNHIHCFGCADEHQALIWLLRVKASNQKAKTAKSKDSSATLTIPGLTNGIYTVIFWNTISGFEQRVLVEKQSSDLVIPFNMPTGNMALAIRKSN